MRILLFGKYGQVGWELERTLQPLGEVISIGRIEADFRNPESLRRIIQSVEPGLIVNAVAYTAVDRAETEAELAEAINCTATLVLAEEALKQNALLIHYSTDYIFDGTKEKPYIETDAPAPLNVYGRTKLAGEQVIKSSGCDYFIFRTSWVYASRGQNFLLTILRLAKERQELSIVSDQIGAPTSARLIAETTLLCVSQAINDRLDGNFSSDLLHLAASGSCSWSGFAQEIVNIASLSLAAELKVRKIKPISTVEYPTPAQRPMNSRLDTTKLTSTYNAVMPDWKKGLELCMEGIL